MPVMTRSSWVLVLEGSMETTIAAAVESAMPVTAQLTMAMARMQVDVMDERIFMGPLYRTGPALASSIYAKIESVRDALL